MVNKKYIEALKLSIEKWLWLFNNPYSDETKSPVWVIIKYLQNSCALCELFLSADYDSPVDMCGKCPLNSERNNCFHKWSPCRKWNTFPEIKKQCAARVVCILRREYEKETGQIVLTKHAEPVKKKKKVLYVKSVKWILKWLSDHCCEFRHSWFVSHSEGLIFNTSMFEYCGLKKPDEFEYAWRPEWLEEREE